MRTSRTTGDKRESPSRRDEWLQLGVLSSYKLRPRGTEPAALRTCRTLSSLMRPNSAHHEMGSSPSVLCVLTLVRFDVSCSAVVLYAGRSPGALPSRFRSAARPLPPAAVHRPRPTPRAAPASTAHPPREPSWQLPRTRTRGMPHISHSTRVGTRPQSCPFQATHILHIMWPRRTNHEHTHTHSPHTAHTLSAPGACRRGTAPHPARSERTTCAAPSLSRSCVWPHPQRLTLGSQRRLSSPLSSLRISRQPCENSPRRSMRQQTPRTRSPRRRPGRRTSWRWRGCARAGRAG